MTLDARELDRLQRDFQALVMERAPGFAAEIAGTTRVPREVRLAIYFDAYRSRLVEILENNFPMLARLLGERQFEEMARAYVESHPSRSFSARWYGDALSQFLATTSPWRGQPALAELATWEANIAHAFDAAEGSPFTAAELASRSPETWGELAFVWQPSVRLQVFATNAPLIWRALSREETPPAPAGEKPPRHWLTWRRGLETRYRSLDALESLALQGALGGETFAGVCETVAAEPGDEEAATAAARMLAQWLEDELIDDMRR